MHFEPRYKPYSFNFSFFACAIFLSSMLCACEPVKYCSAAPKQAGSMTRKSTWSPLESRTVERVSPCEATCVTSPNLPKREMRSGALAPLEAAGHLDGIDASACFELFHQRTRVLLGSMQHHAPLSGAGGRTRHSF